MDDIQRWEYRVTQVGSLFSGPKTAELEGMLNQWGLEGWELVSVTDQPSTSKIVLFARRPLTERVRRERSRP